MITKIETENFKGLKICQPLTGFDIFLGSNGAGKTGRLQALVFALTGQVPGLPKRPADIFNFFSSTPAGYIYSATEMGGNQAPFKVRRRIYAQEKLDKEGNKVYSYSHKLDTHPTKGEKSTGDHEARIKHEIGDISPVVFNFSEFVGMSDADRRKFLFSMIGNDNAGNADITCCSDVYNYLSDALGAKDDEIACELINDAIREYMDPPSAGVHAMYNWAAEQQKLWNAKKGDSKGAAQHMNDVQHQLQGTSVDLDLKRQQLQELNNALAKLEASKANIEKAREMNRIRQERIDKYQERIDAGRVKLDEQKAGLQLLEKQRAEKPDHSEKLTGLQSQIDNTQGVINDLTGKLAAANGRISAYKDTLVWISEHPGQCAIGNGIIPLACGQDLSAFVQDLTCRIDKLEKAREAIAGKCETEEAALRALEESCHRVIAAVAERASIEKGIQEARDTISRYNERLQELEDGMVEAQRSPIVPVEDETFLDAQIESMAKTKDTLDKDIKEDERALLVAAETKGALAENSKAEQYWRAAKSLAEALGPKGLQGVLMSGQLGKLEQDIHYAVECMGREEMFFMDTFDQGKEVLKFGWITKTGTKRYFENLSTGEQMLVTVAILAVLVGGQKGLKLLILDEIQSLDAQNIEHLITGLYSLKAWFDNVLLAGVDISIPEALMDEFTTGAINVVHLDLPQTEGVTARAVNE